MTVDTKAIEKVIRIAARPETVFRLLTDPKEYVRWKGKLAELEPRPGGVFRVDFDDKGVAAGRYVEVVPDRRVVFTWGWEGNDLVPPGSSTVEIDLEPDGEAHACASCIAACRRARSRRTPRAGTTSCPGWRT